MPHKDPYVLIFDPKVTGHLETIDAKYHSLIQKTIHEQLSFEPETETRNRKPLKRPMEMGATWELRFGPNNRFRVLYSIDGEKHEVNVLAIGIKENNQLRIAGKEVNL